MINLSVKADMRGITQRLDALVKKQLPFATAQALNATAEAVKRAEQGNLRKVIDEPTPFTVNAVSVRKASKSRLEAVVYLRPIAAQYLLPYQIGGKNKLNSKALLKPVNAKVNAYGNLPRNFVKSAKGKPNVFVGKVQTKAGVVDGVWQRTKKKRGSQSGLTLLVDFANAHEAKPVIKFGVIGVSVARATYPSALQAAIRKALATAR
jgi:hypothetical protein